MRKVADDETDVTQARNNAVRRNAGVNKGEQALYPDYLQVTVGTGGSQFDAQFDARDFRSTCKRQVRLINKRTVTSPPLAGAWVAIATNGPVACGT